MSYEYMDPQGSNIITSYKLVPYIIGQGLAFGTRRPAQEEFRLRDLLNKLYRDLG